jgi:peroxiredoxin
VSSEPDFVLRLRSSRGQQLVAGHSGRVSFPPGDYRLDGWTAHRRDSRGRNWEIRRAEDEPARVFQVTAGHVTTLPLASPARTDLVVEQVGSEVSFRLRLVGAGQESLGEVRVDGRPLPPPSLRVEDARGRVVARLAGENRCGVGCAMVWRPPRGLVQPLRAIPEADLGPFPLEPAAFRFCFDDQEQPPEPLVGRTAPDFELPPAGGGAPIRLSSMRGQPVLLCFFCGCGDCEAAAKRLAPEASTMRARMVAVVENARQLQPDRIARFRQVTGFSGPVLADSGGVVTHRYRSMSCPRIWLLDRDGMIRYRNLDPHDSPVELAHGVQRALSGSPTPHRARSAAD